MSNQQGYNGWSNYPTWCVSLWLGNDRPLYDETRRRLRGLTQRHEAADALKTFVRDELAPDLGASFAADLLGYALDEVDWIEIVDAWREDAADFSIEDHGSLVLLRVKTDAAKEWANEHLPEDAMHFGGAVVVEPRYVADILDGIANDGLVAV
jgi:hypothetical protein